MDMGYLPRLARGVTGGQVMRGLQPAHGLRVLEPLGQRIDQNGIQPVDAFAVFAQQGCGAGGGVGHVGLRGHA